MNTNLELWEQVRETAPGMTKQVDLQGRLVTTINGMYMVQRATELFGPIGQGWGYDILEDRYDQGAPIYNGDKQLVGHELMHTLKIALWYLRDGTRYSVTHFGHTPYVMKTKWGVSTDFDAPKKSLTDAIKKCLSMLGFSADVFLGLFEDASYVDGLRLKERLADAGDDTGPLQEARQDFRDWLGTQLDLLSAAPNPRALKLLRDTIARKARAKAEIIKYDPGEIGRRVDDAYEKRLTTLENRPAEV